MDLRRPADWHAQQSHKKHRHNGSIVKSFRALLDPQHPAPPRTPSRPQSTSSFQALMSPSTSLGNMRLSPETPSRNRTPSPSRQHSGDSQWDIVEDLPLRWATDFVPLATPGSRLMGASVLSYVVWGVDDQPAASRGARMLAIATKANILLYEAPKGERAFRFMKVRFIA